MKKMLSIALCAAMILSFAASVSASSPRRTLSNKNMPIATSKEEDPPRFSVCIRIFPPSRLGFEAV